MRETFGRGWIEVVCGCMFSGKTEELIRRLQRAHIARQKVQVFKPHIDDRYGKEFVASHSQSRVLSIPVEKAMDILDRIEDSTRVVGVDEAQFFDETIVDVVRRLANRGLRVVVAGLDMDYRAEPFGPMPELMCIAEQVTKLSAICTVCGGPATRTQRVAASQEQVLVGAQGMYEARCREHHTLLENDETLFWNHQQQEILI